jgi:hypothetical protein
MVHSNSICAQSLHERGIKLALGGIEEGILFCQLVRDTWAILAMIAHKSRFELTLHEKLGPIAREELVSHSRDGSYRIGSTDSEAGKQRSLGQHLREHPEALITIVEVWEELEAVLRRVEVANMQRKWCC